MGLPAAGGRSSCRWRIRQGEAVIGGGPSSRGPTSRPSGGCERRIRCRSSDLVDIRSIRRGGCPPDRSCRLPPPCGPGRVLLCAGQIGAVAECRGIAEARSALMVRCSERCSTLWNTEEVDEAANRGAVIDVAPVNRPGRCGWPMAPRPGLCPKDLRVTVRSCQDYYASARRRVALRARFGRIFRHRTTSPCSGQCMSGLSFIAGGRACVTWRDQHRCRSSTGATRDVWPN